MSRFQLADIHRMAVLRRQVARLKEAESQREHQKAQEQALLMAAQAAAVMLRTRSVESLPPGVDTEAAKRAFRQRLTDLREAITERRNLARTAEIETREAFRLARIAHARMGAREETIGTECARDRRESERAAENRTYESTVEITVAGRLPRNSHE